MISSEEFLLKDKNFNSDQLEHFEEPWFHLHYLGLSEVFLEEKRISYGRLRPRVHLRNQDSHFHHLWVEGFCRKILLWERKSWSILIRNHDSISTIFDELRFFFFFFCKNKFYWGKEEELEHFEETWFHHHLHHFFWADVFCRRDFCWGREELEQFEESWFHHLHHILWAEDGCFFGRKIWLWEIRRKMAVLCHCKSQILSLQQQQKRL